MALSPTGGRRMEIRRSADATKHIPWFGSSEGTAKVGPQTWEDGVSGHFPSPLVFSGVGRMLMEVVSWKWIQR